MFPWHVGIALLLFPYSTYQRSLPSSPSYIGAVVEYAPATKATDGRSPSEINADNYLKFIDKAKEYNVDIIVFPESSLSVADSSSNRTVARSEAASYIPDPKDNVVPCRDENNNLEYKSSLQKLSCAARDNGMYVVINHREKVDCRANTLGCPADGYLIYNTHVTFDRDGKVISRYRKYNLFGEPGINITAKPEPTTFETDFGVTFGQFICFDVLFESPAVNLTRDLGVTDIVYSAHWYSELPYGFSMEVQAGWAYANDVNFLASGHSNPSTGSGGSGILIGRKGHAHVVAENNRASNVLVVSEIPKKINGKRLLNVDREKLRIYTFDESEMSTSQQDRRSAPGDNDDDYVYRTTKLDGHTSELIDVERKMYNRKLCNRDLCCEFELKVDHDASAVPSGPEYHHYKYYRYRLVVFNNTMSFAGRGSGRAKICGLIACLGDDIESCGKLPKSNDKIVEPTRIISIDIKMPKLQNERTLFMPLTLARGKDGRPVPLNVTEFEFRETDAADEYEMELNDPRVDLLTFAVVGRNFGINGSSGGPRGFSLVPLFMAFIGVLIKILS